MATAITSTSFGYYCASVSTGTITNSRVRIKQFNFMANAANDYITVTDGSNLKLCTLLGSGSLDTRELYMCEVPVDGIKISAVSNTASTLTILVA